MRSKNHAKFQKKSTKVPKKSQKKKIRGKKPCKVRTKSNLKVKQGLGTGLARKQDTGRPVGRPIATAKSMPCKVHAKSQSQSKSQPGTNLARAGASQNETSYKAPKNVTSQDETSHNGARKRLPRSENQAIAAQGRPKTGTLKSRRGLARGVAKSKSSSGGNVGTNLARAGLKSQPETAYKAPKNVTSQDETSQIGARFDAPNNENRGVDSLGQPETGVSKSARGLARVKSRRKKRPSKPSPILGSSEFKSLQAEWYAKIKADGFQDLERAKDQDGLLSSSGAQPQAKFSEITLQLRAIYYRRLTNFITHNPNWSNDKLANLVASLYIEGISYRKMIPIVKRRLKRTTNVWRIHKIVKALEVRAKTWNVNHPEGLDFTPDIEFNEKLSR